MLFTVCSVFLEPFKGEDDQQSARALFLPLGVITIHSQPTFIVFFANDRVPVACHPNVLGQPSSESQMSIPLFVAKNLSTSFQHQRRSWSGSLVDRTKVSPTRLAAARPLIDLGDRRRRNHLESISNNTNRGYNSGIPPEDEFMLFKYSGHCSL